MDTSFKKATTKTNTKGITLNQNQEKIDFKGEKEIQEEIEENLVIQGELNNKSGTGRQGHVDDISLHRGSDFCNQAMEGQEDKCRTDKTDFGDLDCGSDFCVPDLQEELREVNCGSDFRLIKSSADDSDLSLTHKPRCAKKNTEETTQALSSLHTSVDNFLEETTDALYQYIHSAEFKSRVLQDIEMYTRFTIGRELDSRIEKATLFWQQENIPRMFTSHILQTLTENFIEIHKSLHNIKDNMKGFKSPFDVEDKLGSVLLSLIGTSGTSVAGSMAMMYMSVNPRATQALAAAGVVSGLVVTGLVIGVFDDYETVLKNAYKARIDKLSKPKIKQTLRKTYEDRYINIIQSYLEGYLKSDIDDLSRSVETTQSKTKQLVFEKH